MMSTACAALWSSIIVYFSYFTVLPSLLYLIIGQNVAHTWFFFCQSLGLCRILQCAKWNCAEPKKDRFYFGPGQQKDFPVVNTP